MSIRDRVAQAIEAAKVQGLGIDAQAEAAMTAMAADDRETVSSAEVIRFQEAWKQLDQDITNAIERLRFAQEGVNRLTISLNRILNAAKTITEQK